MLKYIYLLYFRFIQLNDVMRCRDQEILQTIVNMIITQPERDMVDAEDCLPGGGGGGGLVS